MRPPGPVDDDWRLDAILTTANTTATAITEVLHAPPTFLLAGMKIIALWSNIELTKARILTRMMRSDRRLVCAMYFALPVDGARNKLLEAAAKSAHRKGRMSDKDYRLFFGTMRLLERLKRRRNEYAHSVIVHYSKRPELVGLMDPERLATTDAEFEEWLRVARPILKRDPGTFEESLARAQRLKRAVARRRIEKEQAPDDARLYTAADVQTHLDDALQAHAVATWLEFLLQRRRDLLADARRELRAALSTARPAIAY